MPPQKLPPGSPDPHRRAHDQLHRGPPLEQLAGARDGRPPLERPPRRVHERAGRERIRAGDEPQLRSLGSGRGQTYEEVLGGVHIAHGRHAGPGL